jgi:hypothetical protein
MGRMTQRNKIEYIILHCICMNHIKEECRWHTLEEPTGLHRLKDDGSKCPFATFASPPDVVNDRSTTTRHLSVVDLLQSSSIHSNMFSTAANPYDEIIGERTPSPASRLVQHHRSLRCVALKEDDSLISPSQSNRRESLVRGLGPEHAGLRQGRGRRADWVCLTRPRL